MDLRKVLALLLQGHVGRFLLMTRHEIDVCIHGRNPPSQQLFVPYPIDYLSIRVIEGTKILRTGIVFVVERTGRSSGPLFAICRRSSVSNRSTGRIDAGHSERHGFHVCAGLEPMGTLSVSQVGKPDNENEKDPIPNEIVIGRMIQFGVFRCAFVISAHVVDDDRSYDDEDGAVDCSDEQGSVTGNAPDPCVKFKEMDNQHDSSPYRIHARENDDPKGKSEQWGTRRVTEPAVVLACREEQDDTINREENGGNDVREKHRVVTGGN